MAAYKWLNEDQTAVRRYPGTDIAKDGSGWATFQGYILAGGPVDPWKTEQQLFEMALADKLQELRAEKDTRGDAMIGISDPRKKDKIVSRSIKLLRRELKGTAAPQEVVELDAMEALDNHLENLDSDHDTVEQWLEDPARTLEQIQGYDVATDPGWSVLA